MTGPVATAPLTVDVVVPTLGRASLDRLLASLAAAAGPPVGRVILVDDRRRRPGPLLPEGGEAQAPWRGTALEGRVEVLAGRARGPAAARNDGWRAASAPWVAFLDDDVVVPPSWLHLLFRDLGGLGPGVAGSQGRIVVPLPAGRAPTDWERNVAGLEGARWATADLAYRRRVLAAVGGFDERFPRAYREDADLGLRITRAGWAITTGERHVVHPVPPAPWAVSVAKQAGNADDALMDRLHGPGWRQRAGAPAGRRPLHLATTAAALTAAAGAAAGRRRAAAGAALGWLGLTAEFAYRRLAPGPRSCTEVARVAVTSVLIPPVASWHWAAGRRRARPQGPHPAAPRTVPPAAVLFDRDGTLVTDVAYNGDPEQVRPVPGAGAAVARLRAAGVRVGLVSNQSGVAKGLITSGQVEAVNRRVQELLGPFDVVAWCPHDRADGCRCRKPRPGLVLQAAAVLSLAPHEVVVIGDIGSDVGAARAAGAQGLLVPTEVTRFDEVDRCPAVFADLGAAVGHLLGTAS